MQLARFAARRLLEMAPTLLLVSLVVFGLMNLAPGDPVRALLGDNYTPETELALKEKLGLDQPLPVRYARWLGLAVIGDFGTSIRTKEPVLKIISERLPVTATLASLALIVALLVAIPVGVISAANRNSGIDYLSMGSAVLGLSVPNFVLAILLIFLLAVTLRILPVSGYVDFWSRPLEAWRFLVMPVIALGIAQAALFARMLRSGMLDVLNRHYIQTARAKGLKEHPILLRHALRNSLIPVITVVAINFGHLLGGSVVIEQIYGMPGLGIALVSAVLDRDYPVIQGITLVIAALFLLASLVADVLYAAVDPRIRYA